MDQVVHFEIPIDDVEPARGFYGSVFEWGIVPMDEAVYTLVLTTPVDENGPMENRTPIAPGAINGGLMTVRRIHRPRSSPSRWIRSTSHSRRSRPRAGVVKPRTSMGELGAYAYSTDSEGNVIGLFEEP
jgi:predicted enzyme related to lactoylglutathione lyase